MSTQLVYNINKNNAHFEDIDVNNDNAPGGPIKSCLKWDQSPDFTHKSQISDPTFRCNTVLPKREGSKQIAVI